MAATKHPLASWSFFMAAAIVMILLCLIGTRIDNRWFVFLFAAVWLNHLSLLFLFPRNVTDGHTVIAICSLAALCRFAILSINFNDSALAARVVSVLFDLGAMAMLMGLLHLRSLELRWSILYALNPVILFAISSPETHNAVMLFFLLGAIYFYDLRKWGRMFLFAGLSAPMGWVSITTIPFMLCRENWKLSWLAVPATLPAWWFYRHGWLTLPLAGPLQAVGSLSFQGPIHLLAETLSVSSAVASPVSYILLCMVLFYGYRQLHPLRNRLHENDLVSGCFFAMGACLLFSWNLSVWSLGWIIPFIALRPSASWALLSLTAGTGVYGVGTSQSPGHTLWILLVIWLPFGVVFSHDLYLAWHRNKTSAVSAPSGSISVVIPVLEEADRIESCITAVKAHPAVDEIIVVDGGSNDNTVEKAAKMGAVTIRLQPGEQKEGRGGQVHRGIQAATKDLVAIVHADTRVDRSMFQKMLDLMNKHPLYAGGAVGSVFDAKGWRFRMIEIANDFRTVCMGISFGDQVQFFRREPVIAADMFPVIPLMEDVEFAVRLHRLGRQAYFFGTAEVSTRKWEKLGIGHALTVIRLFGTYMLHRLWKTPDTYAMYRIYYRNRVDGG